jgi:hypothetical protein
VGGVEIASKEPLTFGSKTLTIAWGIRRHCEEQSGEAIQNYPLDCFAPLAMTKAFNNP